MDINIYQKEAMSTCLPSSNNDIYAITGLTAEVGEINDKIAKWVRKGFININDGNICFTYKAPKEAISFFTELSKEIGDVLWLVSLLSYRMGFSLEKIAQMNLDKLQARKIQGTIDGDGDGVTKEERL